MASLAAVCWSCLVVSLLCGTVQAYPIGDLSLDGLQNEVEVMTVSRRRQAAAQDSCSFPGLVAVTVNNVVVYSGIYQNGALRLPTDALEILKLSNSLFPLVIYGGDGKATGTIGLGGIEAHTHKNADGTSSITLSAPLKGSCVSNAILYQGATMSVDVKTCKTVNYLGDKPLTKPHVYDGKLRVDPLDKNNLKGCCTDVFPNILLRKKQLGNPSPRDVASSFTCLRSSKGICNGGIGSPVYCTDARGGKEVVVAMAGSGTCQQGEYFAAVDFTLGTLAGFSS